MIPRIFNVYKPVDQTSTDVVRHFKRNLKRPFGKIGHFGTLDPFADGVLLIGVGGASRLMNYVHELLPKTYLAVGILGQKTATGDSTGGVIEHSPWENQVTDVKIIQQMANESLGDYWQSPPAYSATKHQGKALYQWAREGKTIEKPEVRRFIHSLKILSLEGNILSFRVTVSTGTYIRTLFEDMAKKLGSCGHLTHLTRESIGHISIKDSLRPESWPEKDHDQKNLGHLSLEEALPLNEFVLQSKEATLFSNGVNLGLDRGEVITKAEIDREPSPYLWVKDQEGELIGLGEVQDREIKVGFNLPKTPKSL